MNTRILIVDDNPDLHTIIKEIFAANISPNSKDQLEELKKKVFNKYDDETHHSKSKERYVFDSAYQGEDAIKMISDAILQKNPYALIFMDIRMPPGLNGVDTVKKIFEISKDIEVMFITAYSDLPWDQILSEVDNNENVRIVKKPFNIEEIETVAMEMLNKWNLRHVTQNSHHK